jgi:hypothetical protein
MLFSIETDEIFEYCLINLVYYFQNINVACHCKPTVQPAKQVRYVIHIFNIYNLYFWASYTQFQACLGKSSLYFSQLQEVTISSAVSAILFLSPEAHI